MVPDLWRRSPERLRGDPDAPSGVAPTPHHDEDGLCSHVVSGPGWTLFALHRRGRSALVRVCAETDALAREMLGLATASAVDDAPAPDSAVSSMCSSA